MSVVEDANNLEDFPLGQLGVLPSDVMTHLGTFLDLASLFSFSKTCSQLENLFNGAVQMFVMFSHLHRG